MSIDFTKPLQTRDGRKVRLLCTDAHEPYPVIILYEDTKEIGTRTSDGKLYVGPHSNEDLMNIPEEVEVDIWMSVYSNPYCSTISGMKDNKYIFGEVRTIKELAPVGTGPKPLAIFHIKRTVPVGHVDE